MLFVFVLVFFCFVFLYLVLGFQWEDDEFGPCLFLYDIHILFKERHNSDHDTHKQDKD